MTPKHNISPYLFMQFAEPPGTADVDVNASISADGKTVYLHLVNTDRLQDCRISLPENADITAFEIVHDMAEEITPLNPRIFNPVEKPVSGREYILPAAGVSAPEIRL